MTNELILRNELDAKKTPLQTRKSGFVPGVIYGPAFSPQKVAVSYRDFTRVFREAGEAQVIYLETGGAKEPVLIHDVQMDPLTERFFHVDFYRFKKGSKVRTLIPLDFQGVAPAVKDKGGVLFTNIREVEVEALPEKLVHSLAVDLSLLVEVGAEVFLRDLPVPEGVEILDALDTVVVHVVEKAAEAAPAQEEAVAAEGESEEKKAEPGA